MELDNFKMEFEMNVNSLEFSVLVHGRPVKEYSHNGRVFIEAHKGSNYTLKLQNNSWKRVMAVFSVDGLDVINGKPAGNCKNGYIINGYESMEVKGYRLNNNEVASFVFTDGARSYAAEMGDKKNTGVIGVRVFEEKTQLLTITYTPSPTIIWPLPPSAPSSPYDPWKITYWGGTAGSSNSIPLYSCSLKNGESKTAPQSQNMVATEPQFDLGTGWGNKVHDQVVNVEFEPGDILAEMEIFYASRKNLEKMGVKLREQKKIAVFPSAFSGYCQPPKEWRG